MTFYLIARGFHRTFATGAACQQRTLTPADTWSCPTLGLASVLMLRPISPELVLFLDYWVSNIPRYFCFCSSCICLVQLAEVGYCCLFLCPSPHFKERGANCFAHGSFLELPRFVKYIFEARKCQVWLHLIRHVDEYMCIISQAYQKLECISFWYIQWQELSEYNIVCQQQPNLNSKCQPVCMESTV